MTDEEELNHDAGKRAHDQHAKAMELHFNQQGTFGMAAIRAPGLVAAGGVAALLAFVTGNREWLRDDPARMVAINDILFWLFLGLLITILLPALAYLMQLALGTVLIHKTQDWVHPYTHHTPKSQFWRRAGVFFHWVSMLATVGATASVAYGGWLFLQLIK